MLILLTCRCCGHKTLTDEYDRCPVCCWIHDRAQEGDPDSPTGANSVSFRGGQRNFLLFGACRRELLPKTRGPQADEPRDPDWRPLDPPVGGASDDSA